jgi:hypothetical protein
MLQRVNPLVQIVIIWNRRIYPSEQQKRNKRTDGFTRRSNKKEINEPTDLPVGATKKEIKEPTDLPVGATKKK